MSNNDENKVKQAPPPARVTAKTKKVAVEMLALIDALPESPEKDALLLHGQIAEWEYHKDQCQVQQYTHKLTESEKMAGQTINPITGEIIKLTKKGQWCKDCGCSAQEFKRHRKSKKCVMAQQKRKTHFAAIRAEAIGRKNCGAILICLEDEADRERNSNINKIFNLHDNYKTWLPFLPSSLVYDDDEADEEEFIGEDGCEETKGEEEEDEIIIATVVRDCGCADAECGHRQTATPITAVPVTDFIGELTRNYDRPRPPPPPPPSYEESHTHARAEKPKVKKPKVKKLKLKVKK